MVTKSDIKSTVTYLPRLLSALSSLHTIHILGLGVTSDFKAAVANLSLPSVRMLVIPTEAKMMAEEPSTWPATTVCIIPISLSANPTFDLEGQ